MRAIETETVTPEPSLAMLEQKMEALGRDLLDIKRILVLVQHRTVALSISQDQKGFLGWMNRAGAWFRQLFSQNQCMPSRGQDEIVRISRERMPPS